MRLFKLMLLALPLLLFAACGDDDNGVVDPPVDNTDTEKPIVNIIKPSPDQEVSGDELIVEVLAVDNHKVVKVELFLSDSPFVAKTLTAEPWTTTLDISSLGAGVHAVSAKAYDSTGNESNRSTISFVKVEQGNFSFAFQNGSEWVYDRWDLDANNNPMENSKRMYVSVIEEGDGSPLGGMTDWYRMISTDNVSGRADTLIVRTDAQHNIMVYGLANSLVARFLRPLIESGTLPTMPPLPTPEWTYLARVNDANGDPLEPGGAWDVTTGDGIEIPFGLVSATISMGAEYAAKGELINIGGSDIYTWRTRIMITIDLFGETQIPVDIWFSDQPSAQIQLQQESAEINVQITTLPVDGDLQKLISWN